MISATPAEVFRLALILLLVPAYVNVWRELRANVSARLLEVSFLAIGLSFVTSLLDGGQAKPYAEALTHALIAVAGIFALLSAIYARGRAGKSA